ncbi:AdoMet-dependent rRNA methyltransferase spb1, partial [Coemansia helicoidea]
DYNSLIWVFNQLFGKVEATKPPSSRNVSAEIFVVCQNYIAPKKIDPRFLDAKYVFEELMLNKTQTSTDIFAPERNKRKRNREGYEDGDYTLHKSIDAMEFIKSRDPAGTLGAANVMVFESEEAQEAAKLPETTEAILISCKDLKVLGKKDFRILMKWRAGLRERFELEKADEVPAVVEDDGHGSGSDVEGELDLLVAQEARKQRKERRRFNAKRQRQLVKLHLNMTTPTDIGMEHSDETLFRSVAVSAGSEARAALDASDMGRIDVDVDLADEELVKLGAREDSGSGSELGSADDDEDEDAARLRELECEMDDMYAEFVERRREQNAMYGIKKKHAVEDEFHGFGEDSGAGTSVAADDDSGSSSESDVEMASAVDDDGDDYDDDDEQIRSMARNARAQRKVARSGEPQLAARAAVWFDQPVFKGIGGVDLGDVTDDDGDGSDGPAADLGGDDDDDEDDGFEIVSADMDCGDPNDVELRDEERQVDHDLATPEAMTMVRDLANRKTTRDELIDKHFNRYTFSDSRGLPQWFVDDEQEHSKPTLPVSKEAVRMLREKLKALDARPIKKVAEAKARKKMRAAKRIAGVQKKAESVIASSDMSEAEKARSIDRMIKRATKAKPKEKVSVVVARHSNRGVQGRPQGVKGRYKMVDARMKKDLRAAKARDKRKKSKGSR